MQRIIDKQTNTFIRDDFDFNPETEIGLDVEPSQGIYSPKWNGLSWEESATQEYIESLKVTEPIDKTESERIASVEEALNYIIMMM